jgi:hypothetical protein
MRDHEREIAIDGWRFAANSSGFVGMVEGALFL